MEAGEVLATDFHKGRWDQEQIQIWSDGETHTSKYLVSVHKRGCCENNSAKPSNLRITAE